MGHYRAPEARTDDEMRSIKEFHRVLSTPPPPIIFECAACGKKRETTLISDPTLVLSQLDCSKLGFDCDSEVTVPAGTRLTIPHLVPGSFVIVQEIDGLFVPAMIDYVPEKHPEFLATNPTRVGEERSTQLGYHVSFLEPRHLEFGGGWFENYRVQPMKEKHINLLILDGHRRKHNMCMDFRVGDIRRRLYRFSYMAHKYGLKCPWRDGWRPAHILTSPDALFNSHSGAAVARVVPRESSDTDTRCGPPPGSPEVANYRLELDQATKFDIVTPKSAGGIGKRRLKRPAPGDHKSLENLLEIFK